MSNETNRNQKPEIEVITLQSLTEGSHKGYDLKRFIGKWNKEHELGESAESDAIKMSMDVYVDKEVADRPLGNNTYYTAAFETGNLGLMALKFRRDLDKSPRPVNNDANSNRNQNDRPRNNNRPNNRNNNKKRAPKK